MKLATRPALSRAALVLLVVLACAAPWVRSQFADAAAGIVEPRVRHRVSQAGAARVIAELRLPSGPHTAEGHLPSPAAVVVQRHDIARARQQLLARLASRSHRVIHQYESVPFVALEIGPDALFELEASSFLVRRVVEDTLNAPTLPQSVPLTGADRAWTRGFDGTNTMVAIVDTGVEATHPFLAGKVVEEACYSSTNESSTSVCPNGDTQQTGPGSGRPCPLGDCWHGTHVAGIAAGAGTSFSGMAKGAQIMAVQVFSRFTGSDDCNGSPPCVLAWTSDIIAGLERVYALRGTRNIAAANLSLGGGLYAAACDDDPTKAIIDNLRAAGIATIAAAGNSGSVTSMIAPACISTAVSVGATTKSDVVAWFSNVSGLTSLLAPGESIQSSVTGGGFGFASGTSMAAPHVTGAWAVLKEAAPNATVSQILSALQTTGLPITDRRSGNPTTYVTRPRIRVDQAVDALVPVSQPSEIIIDNGAAGTSASGTWCTSGASDFFGTDSLYSCGTGLDTYRWTPSLAAANTYDVYVWWSTHVNRSTAVPVTVVHAGGTTTQTFNEQTGGGRWVLHGRYSFNAGTAGYVQVSSTNGQAAADAVRLVPATGPPVSPVEIVIDNSAPGTSSTGTWCTSGARDFFGADSLYSCGGGVDTYRWTPSLATADTYDVYVWWSTHVNRSTAVPVTVVHAGGTTTQTFNEQTGGGRWVLHGRYSFNAGTAGYVQVSSANGQAAADAVRLVRATGPAVSPEIVIDNGAAGTSSTGTWCTSGASDFFGADSLYSCGGGVDTYRWTPTLASAKTYDVYVWWSTHVNRSTAVPATVVHAAGSTTQTFNEQAAGGAWVLHGRYGFNAGTAGYVQVSSANGQAAADAVRWVPVP